MMGWIGLQDLGKARLYICTKKIRNHSFWGKKIMQKEAEFATFANS